MPRLVPWSLVALLVAAGCGSPSSSSPDAAAPGADAGPGPVDAAEPGLDAATPPDAATPADVGFGLDLTNAQAVALNTSFELVAISPTGAISADSVDVFDFDTLHGRSLLVQYSGSGHGMERIDGTTGERVTIPEAAGRRFKGENSQGDIVFADGQIWRAQTKALEPLVVGNVNYVDHFTGNFAHVLFVNGSEEIVDTVTGKHFAWASTGSLAALGPTKAIAFGGEVMDMTTGAKHNLASGLFWFDESFQDHTGGGVFVGQGCPGKGICTMGESETKAALLSSEVTMRYSTPNFLGDGRYVVALEDAVSQATLVVRGTDAKQVVLQGTDISDFDVLDPMMIYTGLDQAGADVSGRVDLSTGTNLPLTPATPFRKVRFLRL